MTPTQSKARLAELLEQRWSRGLNSQRTLVGEIDNSLRELEASRMKQEQAVQGIRAISSACVANRNLGSLETWLKITKRDAVRSRLPRHCRKPVRRNGGKR